MSSFQLIGTAVLNPAESVIETKYFRHSDPYQATQPPLADRSTRGHYWYLCTESPQVATECSAKNGWNLSLNRKSEIVRHQVMVGSAPTSTLHRHAVKWIQTAGVRMHRASYKYTRTNITNKKEREQVPEHDPF